MRFLSKDTSNWPKILPNFSERFRLWQFIECSMEPKSLPAVVVAAPEPVAPAPVEAPKSALNATFDAYRAAMKASSLEARGMSIAQKMPAMPRSGLRFNGKASDFLDSTNQSIDERLVARFDSAL
jgi:hypothetical protein